MNTNEFDKKVQCGKDFAAVRILDNCEELKVGNIFLTSTANSNDRLAFCKIENIGVHAADKTGVKVGDYVMIDRLATFSHTSPVACLKYDSIICFSNADNTEYYPLKDMLFAEPADNEDIVKVNNIYLQNPEDKLNIGTVTKLNFESSDEYPFAIGDDVMLTKGADVVHVNGKTIHIYKKDMIICKIERT